MAKEQHSTLLLFCFLRLQAKSVVHYYSEQACFVFIWVHRMEIRPGDTIEVEVRQEDSSDGIAYLEQDIVIIANGHTLVGQTVPVRITSVKNTTMGKRLIFAEPLS